MENRAAAGETFTYFFQSFSPFSQWHPSPFRAECPYNNNNTSYDFANCEQWMMYNKAMLFKDYQTAKKILENPDPKTCKQWGRKVKNFVESVWDEVKVKLVYEGNRAKFLQNPELKKQLMSTEGTTLVEASPYDRIWGIGLDMTDPRAASRATWRGQNLLGETLTKLRRDLEKETFEMEILPKYFSDDTSMTISVAKSLLECRGLTIKNLARRFTREYFKDSRYYGGLVGTVFQGLKETDFARPFEPAAQVRNGEGSHGNGSAMRVAPLVLFSYKFPNPTILIDLVTQASRITHSNPLGIAGAIFQALAIRTALDYGKRKPTGELKSKAAFTSGTVGQPPISIPMQVWTSMKENWDALKTSQGTNSESFPYFQDALNSYSKKLEVIRSLLEKLENSGEHNENEVISLLGTGTAALDSVPTAFYIFLASFNPIPTFKTEDQFERSIQYAASLGGDADTIASMAGALSGAYLGSLRILEKSLVRHCFGVNLISGLGRKLYDFSCRQSDLVYSVII